MNNNQPFFPSDEAPSIGPVENFGPPPTNVPAPSAPQDNVVSTTLPKKSGPSNKLLFGLLGIFLLIIGIGAGLFLVQQNQVFQQKAINTTPSVPYGACAKDDECPIGYYCQARACVKDCPFQGKNYRVGEPFCSGTDYVTLDPTCTMITTARNSTKCTGSISQNTTSTTNTNNSSTSTSTNNSTNNSTTSSTTSARKLNCGSDCTSDNECTSPAPSGATVRCLAGKCSNVVCPSDTEAGANCGCNSNFANSCGTQCSLSAGLCGPNSSCAYLTGPRCGTDGDEVTQQRFCIPPVLANTLRNGYQLKPCNNIDGAFYLEDSAGSSNLPRTAAFAFCQQPVTQCTNIKAYDTNWNQLTASQLAAVTVGQVVRITVLGTSSTGNFDKARFTINGTSTPEVTTLKPDSGEYYYEYTIPPAVTSITIGAQIHHVATNLWL